MNVLWLNLCVILICSETVYTNINQTNASDKEISIDIVDNELEREDLHKREILEDARIINKTYVRQDAIVEWANEITNFQPAEMITITIAGDSQEVI